MSESVDKMTETITNNEALDRLNRLKEEYYEKYAEIPQKWWLLDTALLDASHEGRLEIVQALLEAGAKTNLKSDRFDGDTALITASRRGHLEIVEALLKAGANPNLQDEDDGWNALMAAASQEGNLEIVKALLEAGANPNFQNEYGWTALKEASEKGHLEMVKALLKAGANPNLQDEDGYTALRNAVYHEDLEIVQALLNARADPDLQDEDGHTALIAASYRGHLEIVQALLEAGANPNLEDRNGDTALKRASRNEHLKIVQVLEEGMRKYYKREKEKREIPKESRPYLPEDVWQIILKRRIQQELCADWSNNSNKDMLLVMATMDFGVPGEVIEEWRQEKTKSELCKIVSGLLSIGAMYSENALDYLVQRERLGDAFNSGDIDAFKHVLRDLGIEETYYDQYGEERKKSINTLLDELKMRK